MNATEKNSRELRHKKQELRKRKQEILLRELESEIDRSVPTHLINKYEETDSQTNSKLKQQWRRKIIATAQFAGIVIAVVFVVRIAYWVANALIVGGIALIVHKTFFEEE